MKKLTKLIILAGIITFIGAGCAGTPAAKINTNGNANTPAIGMVPNNPASGSFTVTINSKTGEFVPVTAYVTIGTTVTFKNTTNNAHHLVPSTDAANKFAALDSKTDLAPGESFSVVFDKVGRWLYSDAKNTAFGGAIDVADKTPTP
jgi:plastocyanin